MKLYVSGSSVRSDSAISNLELILSEHATEDYELTVIDVQNDPQAAKDNFILATPLLIKVSPEPKKRVVGDLSDKSMVVSALDLTHESLLSSQVWPSAT